MGGYEVPEAAPGSGSPKVAEGGGDSDEEEEEEAEGGEGGEGGDGLRGGEFAEIGFHLERSLP